MTQVSHGNPMRIMTAMYTLRRGGAYDRFLMMLEAFLERNCEIHCLSLAPIRMSNPLFKNHVVYLPFHLNNHVLAKISVLLLFPVYMLLVGWREKIDLFVAFNTFYAFLQAMSKWILRKPMVTLVRGDFSFGLRMRDSFKGFRWLSKAFEYLGLIASDRILTVNTAIQERIEEMFRYRKSIDVEILFNNIIGSNRLPSTERKEIRDRYTIPEDAKILVTAGVLNRGKNIELLLRALPKIKADHLFILLIGEGSTKEDVSYLAHLKEMTDRLGIKERVLFTGWLPKKELWKMLWASDLFLLPSLNEGMPNVLLEAIGLNLPCLGSRIPGIKDILRHDELMFDPFDEQVIAEKVSRFFSSGEYSNHIAQLCQERKETFSFDWKEKAFQMVTEKPHKGGKACQSRQY